MISPPVSPRRFALWLSIGGLVSCTSCGSCGGCGEAEPRGRPQAEALTGEPQAARADAGDASAAAARAPGEPPPGWSKVLFEDEVPLCVFSSHEERHKTEFRDDATTQSLRPGVVWFGAFAPFCVHESCDQIPSLQCWVQRQGDTLIVRSRYWGHRRDDADCISDCRPINAACPTPELEAGKYTVRYGERSFDLRIPSELPSPCFDLD